MIFFPLREADHCGRREFLLAKQDPAQQANCRRSLQLLTEFQGPFLTAHRIFAFSEHEEMLHQKSANSKLFIWIEVFKVPIVCFNVVMGSQPIYSMPFNRKIKVGQCLAIALVSLH